MVNLVSNPISDSAARLKYKMSRTWMWDHRDELPTAYIHAGRKCRDDSGDDDSWQAYFEAKKKRAAAKQAAERAAAQPKRPRGRPRKQRPESIAV
jgi:hypothetical protein